jgi:large subunit ribosomal protein L29
LKKAELRKTVREASDAELDKQLEEARKELFHLRYQRATKQLEKPHRIREARKQIARLLQERTERQKAREAS